MVDPTPADPPLRCDVLVVGGGLHGAALARDLAGRGLRVVLCEQDDLGQHATSATFGLLPGWADAPHAGFGRARQLAAERDLLRHAAPHLAQAIDCVLPLAPDGSAARHRPFAAWAAGLLRAVAAAGASRPGGLIELAALDAVGRPHAPALHPPLHHPRYTHGRLHAGAWVDPARLTVLCALDAAERGATVLTRTRCLHARRGDNGWEATLHNRAGAAATLLARALVNAAGPWAARLLRDHLHADAPLPTRQPRLLKSVHVVVRHPPGGAAWCFQDEAGGPPLLAVPLPGALLALGPLLSPWRGDPAAAVAEPADIDELCRRASRHLRQPLEAADVVHAHATVHVDPDKWRARHAGLRPHALDLDRHGPPLLTVWGGELAAFRWLAEDAADALTGLLDPQGGAPRAAWTRHAHLPGGDLSFWLDETTLDQPREPEDDLAQALLGLRRRHPWLALPLARRWLGAYGDRVRRLLDGVRGPADLGLEVAPGLHDLELHYLKRVEWAASADDVLRRRTRLALHYTPAQRQQVADWFASQADRPGLAAVHTSWHSRLGPR